MSKKPYSERGGGLRLYRGASKDEKRMLGLSQAGPDVSWLSRCKVGDDQGRDGACVIFALASWSEIMFGGKIPNNVCHYYYMLALKKFKRPYGDGMTFEEGFSILPSSWFGGRRSILWAGMDHIKDQPLLAGYEVTAAFDEPNKAGCLNHRAGGHSRGGHAVVIVGRGGLNKFPGEWVWIENSWGKGWGWKGIGVMSSDLHGRLCSEVWRIV